MNTIRDSGFVLKEGARLLTELHRLHQRLHRGEINHSQATQQGLEQIRNSHLNSQTNAIAGPPPLTVPETALPPWEVDQGQVAYDSLMEAFDQAKPDALAAYTGLATANHAAEFLAGEIKGVNYHNAMTGEDANPEITAKAVECFNKALNGDLDAGLEFIQAKYRGKDADESILKEVGKAIGKEPKNLSERNADILKKKATEFLKGRTSPSRFRAEISRMTNGMGKKM